MLTYESGTLYRKGKPAGYVDNCGYIRLSVYGKKVLAHRLIYQMHNPEFDMKSDLVTALRFSIRLSNLLRLMWSITKSENNKNREDARGVSYCKQTGKWKAGLDGAWLGRHDTEEEALNVVTAARKRKDSQ